MKTNDFDVIVMGGGPAGSTCATLLAQNGKRVVLFEKEKFPRHHIGESLIPNSYSTLKRLGVLDKLKAAQQEGTFSKKFGVQFASGDGRLSRPFYFFETNHNEDAVTWQVTRAEFDKMLLDHSRDTGVEVHEESPIREVLFDGDQAIGVEVLLKGEPTKFTAKVVVDATGRSAMLSNRFGIRMRDPELKKAAVYSYYENVKREPGIDEGNTLVLRTKEGNGWFWFIPVSEKVTSIGVVAEPEYLIKDRGRDFQKILDEEIARCPGIDWRLKDAKQVDIVRTESDYSYRSTHCSGDGWMLIGDAYGFLDPLYSSGVLLALKSAEYGCDSILEAFRTDDFSAANLGKWEGIFKRGMESMRKMVYAFYTPGFSFSKFQAKYPKFRGHIIDVLVGDIFKEGVDDLFGPMSEYFDVPEPVYTAAPADRKRELAEAAAK